MIRRLPILAAAALSLAACTAPALDRVAGSQVDDGGFGRSTALNTLAMTTPQGALGHLGARFAAEVPETVTFPFDRATLDATARAALDQQANFMRRFPELRFSVYGHADEVGSRGYNEALGLQRARAVVAYLAARGVSTSRLAALVSYGETRPAVPTQAPERANRRAVTTVSGFAPGTSLLLDGKYAQLAYRRYVGRFTYPLSRPPAGSAEAAPPT